MIDEHLFKHQSFFFIQSKMLKLFRLVKIRSLNVKAVLFQTIQISISTQFSSIQPIDRMDRSNDNEGVFSIPYISSINKASPSDCLVSSPGHVLRESYISAEMQSAYFTALADWTIFSSDQIIYNTKATWS